MTTPFRERNPVPIGLIGIGLIVALVAMAFNVERLPIIGGGSVYSAAFSEAGGLKAGDEVRVAGVKVGTVEEVGLDRDHVTVDFRVKGAQFGSDSGASIRIKTILGQKYLSLEPRGPGQMEAGSEIPMSRTVAPFDVVEAFSGLARTTERIDTRQLAKALDTVATTFEDSPEEVRASLHGLSRLSRTVASRDAKLHELLDHADGVSKVLSDRNEEFVRLIRDGDLLLQEVERRRQVIHTLLVHTARLSEQLTGLVRDNRDQIRPTLDRLHSVVAVLERNRDDLDASIANLAPFVRLFANTLGTGRWFDTYVQNLLTPVGVG